MQIFITGATGFIGQHLIKHLHHQHQVTILSRLPARAYRVLGNDIDVIDDLELLDDLDQFDAVINLAGEPIANKRWTPSQKQEICQSRWQITQKLSDLIKQSSSPPAVFISGSAIGYYGDQNSQKIDEAYTHITDSFTHSVCKKWESIAMQAATEQTRVCIVRTGIVLGRDGGALSKMLPAFQFCCGGPLGNGRQYLSWIHIADMVRVLLYLLDNAHCNGIYNATAPVPVTSNEFSKVLAKTLKRPCLLRVPQWFLQMSMGEVSSLLLNGQRVFPVRLEEQGFKFCYPELPEALSLIVNSD